MNKPLPERLGEWLDAGLLDRSQMERILAFERGREARSPGGRRLLPVLAIALGVLMVGAGVLLFVAANWQHLSPSARFLLVLGLVGCWHLGGALATVRAPMLATALHGLGTLALGAGVFLAGQIFNLRSHWPGGLMLWALGAWLGLALLRDWVQGSLAALLTPAWLLGEWFEAAQPGAFQQPDMAGVAAVGCLLLAITYLTARMPGRESGLRTALAWIGGLGVIPGAFAVAALQGPARFGLRPRAVGLMTLGEPLFLAGWTVALGAPLALAGLLRGKAAWMNALAALWVLALAHSAAGWGPRWGIHGLGALGAVGLILWGLREGRSERVNLGVAGFAITLAAFYFSNVMDKLGRSLGLVGLGLLFLAGGWQLERLRRKLNALIGGGPA